MLAKCGQSLKSQKELEKLSDKTLEVNFEHQDKIMGKMGLKKNYIPMDSERAGNKRGVKPEPGDPCNLSKVMIGSAMSMCLIIQNETVFCELSELQVPRRGVCRIKAGIAKPEGVGRSFKKHEKTLVGLVYGVSADVDMFKKLFDENGELNLELCLLDMIVIGVELQLLYKCAQVGMTARSVASQGCNHRKGIWSWIRLLSSHNMFDPAVVSPKTFQKHRKLYIDLTKLVELYVTNDSLMAKVDFALTVWSRVILDLGWSFSQKDSRLLIDTILVNTYEGQEKGINWDNRINLREILYQDLMVITRLRQRSKREKVIPLKDADVKVSDYRQKFQGGVDTSFVGFSSSALIDYHKQSARQLKKEAKATHSS